MRQSLFFGNTITDVNSIKIVRGCSNAQCIMFFDKLDLHD